jgi:hypothetical protein
MALNKHETRKLRERVCLTNFRIEMLWGMIKFHFHRLDGSLVDSTRNGIAQFN